MRFIPAEIIKKKRTGLRHTAEEISWLVQNFTRGDIDDSQMSAWAMAVFFMGLNETETAWLTAAMRDSGKIMPLAHLPHRVDKHSSGGVGDKTSILIGPILAACGVYAPMIGGRGLGHTGGTLDKFESIPGFRVDLPLDVFCRNIEKHYFSIMSQTSDICPADKKLYALRDVTGTVESLPLICGSIMSKKLAENLTGLVLDIKFGSGAFMKSLEQAEALAQLLKSVGEKNGVRVHALITNMNEVLGRYAGNALEIHECYEILQNKTCMDRGRDFYEPTRTLSLALSGHVIFLAGKAKTPELGIQMATEALSSGRALTAFHALLEYQGPSDIRKLPKAKNSAEVLSPVAGIIGALDVEQIGLANIELGTGRRTAHDNIDATAGLEVLFRLGDKVEKNQPLFRIFAADSSRFAAATHLLTNSLRLGEQKPLPLIMKVLT